MSDYYSILGLTKTASQDEIKRAYRSLASKHHPDKGGDTARFQEIQEAYATLSDPQKRAEYDNPRPQMGGFHFHHGPMPPGFEDVFANFGFPGFFGQRQQTQRNRTLNLNAQITLKDAFEGKTLIANIRLPSGREQMLEVKVPPGIRDGGVIRLGGMGDDSLPNIPRGDLHLTVHITDMMGYDRIEDDLYKTIQVNCIDAMLGKSINVETIDGRTLEVKIPEGCQYGQRLALHGQGMPNIRDARMRGRLIIVAEVIVPTDLNFQQKELLKQLQS